MNLTVYTSDVRNFDEEVDRHFDVRDWLGSDLFDENDRLSLDNYKYGLEPYTYISIIMDMQEQINDIRNQVELQKKWIKTMKENSNEKRN
jgi:hypothetical protein